MRVWITSPEAKEIRNWAMREGKQELADRFHRAARSSSSPVLPFLRTRQVRRPLLFQCVSCQQWEAFPRHRDAKINGWVRYQDWSASWIHATCVEDWDAQGEEIRKQRYEETRRREFHEFLFGQPELLTTYKWVLMRDAPYYEHTYYGVLDDMEAEIQADFGLQRLRKVIDEMPDELRGHLVGAGFLGFHHRYHLVFSWAETIPAKYDNAEFDDVRCESFLVGDLPRRLREQLPESVRALV